MSKEDKLVEDSSKISKIERTGKANWIFFDKPKHLVETNLGYFEHMKGSLRLTLVFSKVVMASLCHAFVPIWYTTYSSDKINELYKKMK